MTAVPRGLVTTDNRPTTRTASVSPPEARHPGPGAHPGATEPMPPRPCPARPEPAPPRGAVDTAAPNGRKERAPRALWKLFGAGVSGGAHSITIHTVYGRRYAPGRVPGGGAVPRGRPLARRAAHELRPAGGRRTARSSRRTPGTTRTERTSPRACCRTSSCASCRGGWDPGTGTPSRGRSRTGSPTSRRRTSTGRRTGRPWCRPCRESACSCWQHCSSGLGSWCVRMRG